MPFTYTHAWPLAATRHDVFRALTDPAALVRWFAEGATVEPWVGGVYRFWGRHTPGTPPQDAARQTVTRLEPDVALGFAWPIEEVDTTVTIVIAPSEDGAGTTLTLTHAVSGELPMPRPRALIDDHWRLAMGNLSAWLAGGADIQLPDYFDQHPALRLEVAIEATPAATFEALIDPAQVNRWLDARDAVIEPHAGGRYELHWQYEIDGRDVTGGPTHILEFARDRLLMLDWPDWRGDASVPTQTLTFHLEPVGTGTAVTLVHAGFLRAADVSDYGPGWRMFLQKLKTEVEGHAATATLQPPAS